MSKIKICCDELEHNIDGFEVDSLGRFSISTFTNHWWSLDGVKYCPFCGKKLEVD